MNKRFVTLLTGAIAALSLASCQKSNPLVKEYDFEGSGIIDSDYLSLKSVVLHMGVGESKSIQVDSFPGSYASSQLEFVSSNESVATVSSSGQVTAIGKGITDITISSKDGLYSSKSRVAVSSKSSKSGCQEVLDAIGENYKSESYKAPTKVIRYEYSKEMYCCEGVDDHGLEGYEAIGYNSQTGYFFIDGPSLYYKTPYGDPEASEGKWIFYPISGGMFTRLIHITPTSKTFLDMNTANYGSDHDRRIRDVLNMFFVSGEKIVQDMLDDYEGLEDYKDFQNYNDTQYYSIDNSSLVFTYHQERDDVVTAKEEIDSLDIPADTPYNEILDLELLHSNNRGVGYNVNASTTYERDGKNWERKFIRSQLYEGDFEEYKVSKPEENGYMRVDSLYDL